jgi:hypothetical protein
LTQILMDFLHLLNDLLGYRFYAKLFGHVRNLRDGIINIPCFEYLKAGHR